ncbi:MAG: hypothetical protein HYX78_08675 [Armatimonadetes bacterium]|nr:hypothetical protein [Armatimonadota bacterium]
MRQPKIGLLPLYIKLYDDIFPEFRPGMDAFAEKIAFEFRKRGLDVGSGPVCRVKSEFSQAIREFEESGVDAIVTLHLAYSPSLESAEALAATRLPLIVLDTTPAFEFGQQTESAEIAYNHGVHGVQDMCNMLIRNGKPFQIEAGHWEKSDVLDRVVARARSAQVASRMRNARVGRIGQPFAGMGDFAVPADVLRSTIGLEVVSADPDAIRSLLPAPRSPEVDAEINDDLSRFISDGIDPEAHRKTAQVSVAIKKWIERESLSAFSANFMEITRASGLPTPPFLAASKAMAKGIGYAGEGDALTAALVGALGSVYGETTFTEIFCPDWADNSLFLSHMGEMNIDLAAGKPKLMQKPFPFTDADDPVIAVGKFREGEAVLVNLAPGISDAYTLIVAPVRMLDAQKEDRMSDTIRGWASPSMPVDQFLSAYSYAGGTHHSALAYGDVTEEVAGFGEIMGWDVVVLG